MAFARRPSVVDNAKIHNFTSCLPLLSKVIKISLRVKARLFNWFETVVFTGKQIQVKTSIL